MRTFITARALAAASNPALPTVVPMYSYAGDALTKIRETQTMTLAHCQASVPFSSFDDKKKQIGYALDLCLKITDAGRFPFSNRRRW